MAFHLTKVSMNEKTGPIPVSVSGAETCPQSCPFRDGGCYAKSGPLSIHWARVTGNLRGGTFEAFLAAISELPCNQLWRHNAAGDLAGEGTAIDAPALAALTAANRGKRGFTYTHKPVLNEDCGDFNTVSRNREAIAAANRNGFTVNLSGNNPAHADKLAALGLGPVVTVLPAAAQPAPDSRPAPLQTPQGRKIVVCPAVYKRNVTCASCGLCQRVDRSVIVGFPAHGTAKRKAGAIAERGPA